MERHVYAEQSQFSKEILFKRKRMKNPPKQESLKENKQSCEINKMNMLEIKIKNKKTEQDDL